MTKRNRYSFAAVTLLALALPFLIGADRFLAFVVAMTFISLLWATGMNLMYGYVGLIPLMFGGIVGIAAYTMVYLVRNLGWSFWLSMPVAVLFASIIGIGLGLPALRLKGFYFALCSLVVQSVLTLAFIFFPKFTNGDIGIPQIAPPVWFGGEPLSAKGMEVLIAFVAVAGVLYCAWVTHTDLGRRFIAVREDDILAESIGIKVVRTKLISFILSVYAGVGGCLYAVYVGFISPRAFDVLLSLNIWLFVAFGGRGTLVGPIIGTIILAPIPYLLQDMQAFEQILSGGLIIVVALAMPAGIYGAYLAMRSKKPRRHLEARAQEQRV
ncbi:Branched-chain amino acid transport system permease protein OS=Castellaniella defragrans OX=75697 GN=HNR28_003411 PE=4 SV=1 [Castellaniella defragrans]